MLIILQYGDIARMLNMYQLWLDDLYPRAKFADALAIIEKVGHTKRMQVDRRAWIDEGKPKHTAEQDEDDQDAGDPEKVSGADQEETGGGQASNDETIYAQLESETAGQARGHPRSPPEEPDEDELDALLAESVRPETEDPRATPAQSKAAHDDPFADEMEAMEGMEDMW